MDTKVIGDNNDFDIKVTEICIYTNPLPLLEVINPVLLEIIDNYLPYSHGMEFECVQKDNYDEEVFKQIPNIMAVNVDNSEQRYRIPSGLKGMICLWEICKNMKIHSIVSTESSNHYHTDLTDIWEGMSYEFKIENIKWILEELKTWNTAINYNQINSWYRWNDLQTLEIRIGEPTFDYSVIIKRLIQCANIVRRLKSGITNISQHKLENINRELKLLNEKETIKSPILEHQQQIINTRIIRI